MKQSEMECCYPWVCYFYTIRYTEVCYFTYTTATIMASLGYAFQNTHFATFTVTGHLNIHTYT